MKDIGWVLTTVGIFLNLISGISLLTDIVGMKKFSQWEENTRVLVKQYILSLKSYELKIVRIQDTISNIDYVGFFSNLRKKIGMPF